MTAMMWRGILIPFLGTALGAACVFFMRKELGDSLRRAMTGFAAGVMTAASIWSLLIPSLEQSDGMGAWSFVPPVVGFWIGILFLLLLDRVIPHLHQKSEQAERPKTDCAARRCLRSRCFCIIYRREWSSACFTRDLLRTARSSLQPAR